MNQSIALFTRKELEESTCDENSIEELFKQRIAEEMLFNAKWEFGTLYVPVMVGGW